MDWNECTRWKGVSECTTEGPGRARREWTGGERNAGPMYVMYGTNRMDECKTGRMGQGRYKTSSLLCRRHFFSLALFPLSHIAGGRAESIIFHLLFRMYLPLPTYYAIGLAPIPRKTAHLPISAPVIGGRRPGPPSTGVQGLPVGVFWPH